MASRPPPGTSGTRPPPTPPRRSPRPSSTVPPRSTPRSIAGPPAGLPPGGPARDTSHAMLGPNAVDQPSQPPSASVLRRPPESTQYVSIRYTERLLEAGIEPSVGSAGDSYDNALAETVIGLFKTEVIRRRGRGARWKRSSTPPLTGSIGTTTAAP